MNLELLDRRQDDGSRSKPKRTTRNRRIVNEGRILLGGDRKRVWLVQPGSD